MSETPPSAWKPRAISISAGGVLMIGQIGVLATLIEAGMVSDVSDWYGCSGGAMVALCGVMGVSPGWLRDLAETIRLKQTLEFDADSLVNFTTHWGLNDGTALMAYIGRLIETWMPGAAEWTFADIVKFCGGRRLTVTATNVGHCTATSFSVERTPNMRVIDALRASIAVPILFTPWIAPTGEVYSDGAVAEYFPWHCVADKENTLVITSHPKNLQKQPDSMIPRTLGEYIRCLYNSSNTLMNPKPANWISLKQKRLTSLDFRTTPEEQMELFAIGTAAAEGWLAWRRKIVTAAVGANPPTPENSDRRRNGLCFRPSPVQMSGIPCTEDPEHRPPVHQSDPQSSRRFRRWSL